MSLVTSPGSVNKVCNSVYIYFVNKVGLSYEATDVRDRYNVRLILAKALKNIDTVQCYF